VVTPVLCKNRSRYIFFAASNIEVKARSKDLSNQKKLAEKLVGRPPQLLIQEDVFVRPAQGRLKLRILGSEKGPEGKPTSDCGSGSFLIDAFAVPPREGNTGWKLMLL
jgi:hypothetical protein